MPLPANWPPRLPSGNRSIRFYATGTATGLFSDNAFLFAEGTAANTYTPLPVIQPGSNTPVVVPNDAGTGAGVGGTPPAMIWSGTLCISNDSATPLEFSFDGTNVHGKLLANEVRVYRNRFESGVAVRGGGAFRIEAW